MSGDAVFFSEEFVRAHLDVPQILPSMLCDAVLVDPQLRDKAAREVDAYIVGENAYRQKIEGKEPLHIIDFSSSSETPEAERIIRTVKEQIHPKTLRHKVDVLQLFPKWIYERYKLKSGKEMAVVSPIVCFNYGRTAAAIQQTLDWLKGYGLQGEPDTVMVLPDQWIQGDADRFCYPNGKSLCLKLGDSYYGGLFGDFNILRHETNHAGVIADSEWDYSYSRSVTEGIDLLLEMLESQTEIIGGLGRKGSFFRASNLDLDHIAGFSAERTYQSNGIKPIDGEYVVSQGHRRGAEYFQGAVLMSMIYAGYGGFDAVKRVYKHTTQPIAKGGSEEQLIEHALKEGLSLNNDQLKEFKDLYTRLCGYFGDVRLYGKAKPWKGIKSQEEEVKTALTPNKLY